MKLFKKHQKKNRNTNHKTFHSIKLDVDLIDFDVDQFLLSREQRQLNNWRKK